MTTGGNVVERLRGAAERSPQRSALVLPTASSEPRSIHFGELWRRVAATADGLRQHGLRPGDRALVMIPMSLELYVALLAVLTAGGVGVFVDPWIGWRQIADFAALAEPRAFLGTTKSHLLRFLDERLRRLPIAVTSGGRWGRLPAPATLTELGVGEANGGIEPVLAEQPALISFTSGSSGRPKGANRTHGFLAAQDRALTAEFPPQVDDVDMTMFPVFALHNLASGVPTVVPPMDFRRVAAVDAAAVLALMKSQAVTTCTASPPFFDRLAAYLSAGPRWRPPLRRILTGGAPVDDRQLRAWRRALPATEIQVVYGSTEAEPVAHIEAEERLAATSDVRPEAPGYCLGPPSPRIRLRVVRIHRGPIELGAAGWRSWELAAGEIGEFVVTGDHVGKDYYRSPEAVRENKIRDPAGEIWHRMGDTGYRDRGGRLWLVGRLHTTLFRAGQLAHPQLIEQAVLGEDSRITRAAAVGLPDPDLGERVVLVLEAAASGTLAEEAAARVRAAGLLVDRILVSGRPLPVDPRHNSKVDYSRLRSRLLDGTA